MKRRRKGEPAAETALGMLLIPILKLLESQIGALELAVADFQRAQRMLPIPSPLELAEMRKGSRPVGRTTFLLGLFRRFVVALDEITTALRDEIKDGTKEAQLKDLSVFDFNYIGQAIEYVRRTGALSSEEEP